MDNFTIKEKSIVFWNKKKNTEYKYFSKEKRETTFFEFK